MVEVTGLFYCDNCKENVEILYSLCRGGDIYEIPRCLNKWKYKDNKFSFIRSNDNSWTNFETKEKWNYNANWFCHNCKNKKRLFTDFIENYPYIMYK